MVVKCEIKFDNNPHGIYFAGQTLSGTVELTIDKPKKIRGLILKIEGFAKVQWSETEQRRSNRQHNRAHNGTTRKTVQYSGREDYLNTISYLIGSSEGNQIEIEPGAYQYNFQAVLPPMLPTSFEAKHGSIRYVVNVVIDRPWKFDLTYKNAFTVLKQLDLNYENPALKIPTTMEVIKTFYCGFCKTAPLFLAASVPMSGYVSGQTINVSIEINNQSRIEVEDVKVSLKKLISYNSQTPRKHTKEEILSETEIRCGKVQKQSKAKLDQKILIPPVPPSNLNYCRVLNVAYEIHVTAKAGGVHKNPTIKIPLTIGTVPLNIHHYQPYAVQHASAPSQTPSPTNQVSFSDSLTRQMNSPNPNGGLPPPTYHEAVGSAVQLNEDGEHTLGSRPFLPMYPVYNFNNDQSSSSTSGYENNGFRADTPLPGSISDAAIIQKY